MSKIAIIILALLPLFATAKPPANLYDIKQKLIYYHDSGQYNQNITTITNQAIDYVKTRIAQNKKMSKPKKLAAIFDIDETSLSNYPTMIKLSFGGTPEQLANAQDLANDPAIPSTLKLYNFAIKNGITVFFITGRNFYQRQATINNLHIAGYKGWQKLFMKPYAYHQFSVVPYKAQARKKITQMGYDIIISIGDQQSDLKGGYADKTFKVPNPYYYIP